MRPPLSRLRLLYAPLLVGATWKSRAIACLGAILGVGLAGLLSAWVVNGETNLPLLAAPLGASTVLVFALPASPIAQPWPVIGGNTISALSGLLVTQIVHDQLYACGLAVGLAIAAMTLTRSLHPPGGGMALTTVIGGSSIAAKGAMFAFAPVCLNSLILVLVAWAFHRVSGHSYPHKPPQPARTAPIGGPDIRPEDIDAAITDMGEALDINRRDLDRLLIEAQRNARARAARE